MNEALFRHFLKVSIDHLFDNLESGNELLFWTCSLNLKICMNPPNSNLRETCCLHHLNIIMMTLLINVLVSGLLSLLGKVRAGRGSIYTHYTPPQGCALRKISGRVIFLFIVMIFKARLHGLLGVVPSWMWEHTWTFSFLEEDVFQIVSLQLGRTYWFHQLTSDLSWWPWEYWCPGCHEPQPKVFCFA